LWVPADQVPAPELALADDHLLHVEVLGDLLEACRRRLGTAPIR